jgi:hypothetical protein
MFLGKAHQKWWAFFIAQEKYKRNYLTQVLFNCVYILLAATFKTDRRKYKRQRNINYN